MKIINKSNFIPTVCVVYTMLSMGKILIEWLNDGIFGNYQQNLIAMLVISVLTTFVLSQHYRLDRFPLLVVIVLQYVILLAVIMGFTWISSFFGELHPDGYVDMFRSFTIPYMIGAAVYYIELFMGIRKTDKLLQKYKERTGRAEL